MPSKYSHGVVLAGYSSRGIINLPNDEQLDHLKPLAPPPPVIQAQQSASATTGRFSSAPLSHNHRSTVRSTSTATSKSTKRCSSILSVNNASSREPRNRTATSHYWTLGDPQIASPASRSRRVIIDSEEEDMDDGGTKNQDLQPGVPIHSEASPPFESALEDSCPIQWPILNGEVESLSRSQASTRRPELKHISSLAAQKHAGKADLRDGAQPYREPNQLANLLSRPPPGSSAEPLLSVHEFLGHSPILVRRTHLGKPRPFINTDASKATSIRGSQLSELVNIPTTILESRSRHASERGRASITGLWDDENHSYDRSKNNSKYSTGLALLSSIASKGQCHGQAGLDLTEEQPSDVINTPATPNIQADFSQTPLEEPDLDVSETHNYQPLPVERFQRPSDFKPMITGRGTPTPSSSYNNPNPPQNMIAVEPDFSNFSDDEERGDPMNSALTDIYTRRRYYRAGDRDVARNELSPSISQPTSPQSIRRNHGRPLWSLISARPRASSMNSDARNRQQGATSKKSTAIEDHSTLNTLPTIRKLKAEKQELLELKSEEEMRAKIPTPIPSPASSAVSAKALGARKMLPSSPRSNPTPPRTATHVSNIGMPSIVRSPQGRMQGDYTNSPTLEYSQKTPSKSQRKATISGNSRDMITPTPTLEHEGTFNPDTYDLDPKDTESEDDEASQSWTLPTTPVSQQPAYFKSTPLRRLQDDFVTGSRPGSTTPRPQRRLQQQNRQRSQSQGNHRATPLGRRLASAFDETFSISSRYRDLHIEPDPDINIPNYDADQPSSHEEQDDLDAAPPPPDISRYPPSHTSPRSAKNEQHRLSSLTSLSRRSKTKRRFTVQYDDRIEAVVRNLNVGLEGGKGKAAEVRPGPGSSTGVERLETLIREAEEEAKANRGMKGIWARFKRRIEI